MRLFYFGFAVLLSVALGLLSVFNALYLDWSLLEIGVICIMPALVIMDLFCMAAQVWAVRRGGMKKERFFSFFGENWGCPGLPFPFTPCGFHRDPGGTEGSGNEHQDPPQL